MNATQVATALRRAGGFPLRYGLVLALGWIGLFKFTPTEAAGIEPLVRHSPLLSWTYALAGVRGVGNAIGAVWLRSRC